METEDIIEEITEETPEAEAQSSEDTTPIQTQEEYEEIEDNKLKFTDTSENPDDIIIEDEY